MPTTKNAFLRYRIIDRCLRNSGRRFSFDDIKAAIEEELHEINPDWGNVSIRTLGTDIEYMRSIDGYDAPNVSDKHQLQPGEKVILNSSTKTKMI